MPLNSIPPTTTVKNLEVKISEAAGKCAVDYGFWGGVIPGNAAELLPMILRGALGFKAFMIDSGVTEFPMSRENDLEQAMMILSESGRPLLFHAELEPAELCVNVLHTNRYIDYLASRPPEWEVNAIKLVIALSRKTRCRAHIVHLSAADALPTIVSAKSSGVRLTVESCPHYLFFNAEAIADGFTQFKCAPPIRTRENQRRLWDGLESGAIDFVVSDHSPCTPSLKRMDIGDFGDAWGGISGLQLSLLTTWTAFSARGWGLETLAKRMCEEPARFCGMGSQKGRIKTGYDADLIAFDSSAETLVSESMIRHRHKLSPYLGLKLRGKVTKTFLRGQCIFDGKELIGDRIGRQLKA